jgi:hypothetical protein
MDFKIFGYSYSGVNIRIDSGSDPTPGTNSGKITYNINGSDKHIMTATGLGINITSPGLFALNVNGDTLISNHLNVSGTTKLNNNTTLFSSLNVSSNSNLNNLNLSGTTYFYGHLFSQQNLYTQSIIPSFDAAIPNKAISINTRGLGNINLLTSSISTIIINRNNTSIMSSLNVSGPTTLNNATTINSSLNVVGNITTSGLSVFNINSNLNSLSSYSFLNISGISNNLNSLSTNSVLSINNLNSTSNSIFNNLNSLSSSSILSINN